MIKLRLTRKEYLQLYALYDFAIPVMQEDTDEYVKMYFDLLVEHMVAIKKRIHLQLINNPGQEKFTLKLQAPEALAFYQVWNMIDTSQHPYGTVVVARCIGTIDKIHVNKTHTAAV